MPLARPARTPTPAAALGLQTALFASGEVPRSVLSPERRRLASGASVDLLLGLEAKARGATDAGSLLGRSITGLGVVTQKRSPIINEPRLHGSRVGSLPGSGSHWVPARIDLDTMLSKIDSRFVNDVLTINGPYAARYGPGFYFVDVALLDAPRFEDGFESFGSSGVDYGVNGEQWHGRQMAWGGAKDWGFRVGYSHRTGNDYTGGSGEGIPSSHNSRDVIARLGRDLCDHRHVEFTLLRQDQTNVELPGQAFDIDVLCTDGYEISYVSQDVSYADCWALDVWYNRTWLFGSAQRSGKRLQFPIYDAIGFQGTTDVDSFSTGFRSALSWEGHNGGQLTLGADMRYLAQQLNEITSGQWAPPGWTNANSPIPDSYLANPGLFVECSVPMNDRLRINAGARADVVSADIREDAANLSSLGTQSTPGDPVSYADIVGTDEWTRIFGMWSIYTTCSYDLSDCWTVVAAAGYAERPPSLTELYASEPFMFVLQNGLNTVTGDPRLDREQSLQTDVGLRMDYGCFRGGIRGYHAWAWDYITFENMRITSDPNTGLVAQQRLKYVNTDLATFLGADAFGEYDVASWLTLFATLSCVDGQDRTRNGDFATEASSPGSPSRRVYGLPRGAFSGIAGAAKEPLPSISPLESRLGIRVHEPHDQPRWAIELTARLVDGQDRVATSLLEPTTPGFTTWDVRGYWQTADRLLLVAGVENFTDRTYREHLDFRSVTGKQMLQPGVNVYGGAEFTY
jgi:outer membrane receptor protein involved in Fe transport